MTPCGNVYIHANPRSDRKSGFVGHDGEVIRHNFGWTIVLLVYLVSVGVACHLFFPGIAVLRRG